MNGAQVEQATPRRRGRPPGWSKYPGREKFLERLRIAFRVCWFSTEKLAKRSRTQIRRIPRRTDIAYGFAISVRTLDAWLLRAETTWAEQVSINEAELQQLARGKTHA